MIVHEIRSWMNKRMVEVAPKSSMGKALGYLAELSYAEEQRLRSVAFCFETLPMVAFHGRSSLFFWYHPELQLDTNLVKNVIRPFVVGRKNWLFSGCPKGASASAGFYSLIQSAKLAGFDPFVYLRDLFNSWETKPRTLSYLDLPQLAVTCV
ncbi:IS66 family element, transposase domain protein [Leptospira kirschneri str. H2]|nr:IS66 family element, transposase domain protein [Leptospira kirschneri str. H2]